VAPWRLTSREEPVLDPLTAHEHGVELAIRTTAAIPAAAWGNPTPCTEWDVRDVVNHMVADSLWVPDLVAGRTIEEVGDAYAGDVLADEPAHRAEQAHRASQAAFEQPGALERTVHLSFGDVPGEVLCHQRATDLIVHSWDLARGAGIEVDVADEVASYLESWNRPWFTPEVREMGVAGPEVPVPAEAPGMDRLLGLLGRQP
jgi:uncharacterized protein (TIGR03086 family)